MCPYVETNNQRDFSRKRGKSPGTQVQHSLAIGTKRTEFRHFLTSDCGTVWTITKSARTFAPLTFSLSNPLITLDFTYFLTQQC